MQNLHKIFENYEKFNFLYHELLRNAEKRYILSVL